MSGNKPEYIVIHHSHTVDSETKSWDAIRKYHIETNGWKDIGYHKGIERIKNDVMVFEGRADDAAGAHAKELGMNNKSIGICVVGNYDIIKPSSVHLELLKRLCHAYMANYNIPVENIIGHRDVGMMAGFNWRRGEYKSCPGEMFDMDDFRKLVVPDEPIIVAEKKPIKAEKKFRW